MSGLQEFLERVLEWPPTHTPPIANSPHPQPPPPRDVMAVMASLLHFTDEEKASAELYFERKEDKGMVGRVVGGIVAPLPPPVLDVEQLEGENVRDKFVSYLLAESGGD